MNRAEAIRVVAMLQGAYPRTPLPDSTAEVYALTLGDMEYAEVKQAVTRLIQTSKWLPAVSEIRSAVVEARVALPSPEVAWGEVRQAIGRVGSYMVPVFECEEIDRAVRLLGWRNICLDENTAATRARFLDAYRSLRDERMELEATGRYVPSGHRLPSGPVSGFIEDGTRIPVLSSFLRRHLTALPPAQDAPQLPPPDPELAEEAAVLVKRLAGDLRGAK